MSIRFYCGLTGEKTWNGALPVPGDYACVAPVHGRSVETKRSAGVYVPVGTRVLLDSGAFSDNWACRLNFELALNRQLVHAEKYGYMSDLEAVASYDKLVDEKWLSDGSRKKSRLSEHEASDFVNETINAGKYLSKNRGLLPAGVVPILNAQGVTPAQYLSCVARLLWYMNDGDWLGLGGWCVLGLFHKNKLLHQAYDDTLRLVFPFIAKRGVKRVHIYGVVHPPSLGKLLYWANQYQITVSTDSMSPALAPTKGEWGYGDRRKKIPVMGSMSQMRKQHVEITRLWLSTLDQTQYYRI